MPRKQKKGKSKDTAPKVPSSVTQKPPNTKLMLRVPPFSGAKAQAVPEIVPEAASGSLQPDEDIHIDSDTYMPEIPYVPSPRQQLIDHYWENITDTAFFLDAVSKEMKRINHLLRKGKSILN